MAEVFLAVDRAGGDRLVVIKRILPHLGQLPEFVDAFGREARVAARIHHPNVVRIFELGEASGLPYIAMEYLPGSSLRDLVGASGGCAVDPLPIGVALHLVGQACAGAHATHELTDTEGRPFGLVHRDITPHNLMVDDRGHVKLLDFGIAKASEGMDQTRTGMLKGKIAYMSPEQCRQERLDRRSDVFSLGVVGYQLLTGVKPFQGTSELATMQAIITGRYPKLATVRPDVPRGVAAAIERALANDAAERFPTAEALRAALDEAGTLAGCPPDPEGTARLVRSRLGAVHDARRKSIDDALNKTLEPFSTEPRIPTESLDGTQQVLPRIAPTAPARSRWPWPTALAGLGLLAAMIAVAATIAWVAVRAGTFGGAAVPLGGVPIPIVVAPTTDPAALSAELEPLRVHLQRALQRPVALAVAPSYRDAAEVLVAGGVPYAVMPPNTIRHTMALDPRVSLVAVKVVDGSTSTDGFLLVRRSDAATTVDDLRGRTVCWTDAWSATGYVLPRRYLADHGLDPDTDVGSRWSGNHVQALRDLLDGQCDAAATYSGNFQTADQRGIPTAQLRILAITGTSHHDAVVAGPAADPAVTADLREALLAFAPATGAGRTDSERISGFVEAPPDYLGSTPINDPDER
ncbi:MAG: serine/threonine-protein kinase [Myxococcota bacterium]